MCNSATKATGGLNIKYRHQVKECDILLWQDASLWAPEVIPLHYLCGLFCAIQITLFPVHLAPCVPQPQQSPWQMGSICRITVLGAPHSHLETRNCWWLWHFLLINMAGYLSLHRRKVLLCLAVCFKSSSYPFTSQERGRSIIPFSCSLGNLILVDLFDVIFSEQYEVIHLCGLIGLFRR